MVVWVEYMSQMRQNYFTTDAGAKACCAVLECVKYKQTLTIILVICECWHFAHMYTASIHQEGRFGPIDLV